MSRGKKLESPQLLETEIYIFSSKSIVTVGLRKLYNLLHIDDSNFEIIGDFCMEPPRY
jgi:hypothetical protein